MDWSALAEQCTEVVVFGSHAAGLQTRSSDLDVLLVGKPEIAGMLPKSSRLDIVFRTGHEVQSADWLKSELAGHIASYGRWLRGADTWRTKALETLGNDSTAAAAKRLRIARLSRSIEAHWDRLTTEFRIEISRRFAAKNSASDFSSPAWQYFPHDCSMQWPGTTMQLPGPAGQLHNRGPPSARIRSSASSTVLAETS